MLWISTDPIRDGFVEALTEYNHCKISIKSWNLSLALQAMHSARPWNQAPFKSKGDSRKGLLI